MFFVVILAVAIILLIFLALLRPKSNDYSNNKYTSTKNNKIKTSSQIKPLVNMSVSSELNVNPKYAKAIEKAEKDHIIYISNSKNPKWHRTKEEKSSSSNFSLKYRDIISPYETQIYNNGKPWDENIGVDAQISACKQSIAAFNELRQFCYENSGELYFQDMWEHCHNSREECFSYSDKLKEQLEYLESHRVDLIYVEQHKPSLRSELKTYLFNHNNVIQKDIYKDFNPLLKSSIQSELYFMAKEGIIERTKKGSSYIIHLTK